MDLSFFTSDTKISKNMQLGMALTGGLLTKLAREASPTDDTPGVLTGSEKMEALGDVAKTVVAEFVTGN